VFNKSLYIFNSDLMKHFLSNILILAAPFVIYLIIVVLVDPFNYLNFSKVIDDAHKEEISQQVEQHLYRMIHFENDRKRNISLGDSRAHNLARELNSENWANLSFGGASLKESIQAFWWVVEDSQVDTVLFAVSFNNYNKYNKRFWVDETLKFKKNFFSYSFNKYTFRCTILLIKSSVIKKEVSLNKTHLSKEDFWKDHINNVPQKFFVKYSYPENYYNDLLKISHYCSENQIELIFWIPPSHAEYHAKVGEYNLLEEEEIFKNDIISLGEVYDYNFPNEITENKECFRDPVHVTNAIAASIRDEILYNKPFVAKHSKP